VSKELQIRTRYGIRLPDDLYDKIEAMAHERGATVQELAAQGVGFWLAVTSEADASETKTHLTSEEEQLVFYFLRFLRRADPDALAAVRHVIEGWRKRESLA
jgi:hypothetical protein